jgi:N4-(beta-N-acetylglucosaminyl)-L-asparaginase
VYAVSIWPRGLAINAVAAEVLKQGGGSLDAIEAALRVIEDDTSDPSTGVGGLPNAEGEVELDAAILHAPTCAAGAVGALRRTRYAISVARKVMELTPHLLLAGAGAEAFARAHGFPEFNLLTESSERRWREWQKQTAAGPQAHDTMGTIAIDQRGELSVGVTTSGTGFKAPGRVGDSPILGAGLYGEQSVGGALATGVGEEAMRVCATFRVVEFMRQGVDPTEACRRTLEHLLQAHPATRGKQLALAALRIDGVPGGACLNPGFAYPYFDGNENRLVAVTPIVPPPGEA